MYSRKSCTFQLLKHWSSDWHLPAQHNWPVRRSEIYEHSHKTCTAQVTVHCLYPRYTYGTPCLRCCVGLLCNMFNIRIQILQRTSCITDRVIFQGERIPAKLTPALPRYRLEQSVITCKLRTRSEQWSICFGQCIVFVSYVINVQVNANKAKAGESRIVDGFQKSY